MNPILKVFNEAHSGLLLVNVVRSKYNSFMKTTIGFKKTEYTFVVGTRLPEKLPRKAVEFLGSGTTPQRAFDIAEKASKVADKVSTERKKKVVC